MPPQDDIQAAFEDAARLLHHVTKCVRVQLTIASPPTEFRKDFGSPSAFSIEPNVLSVECLSRRGDILGVLEIATGFDQRMDELNRPVLEGVASLLARALSESAAQARVAELERFQRESTYL